MAAQIPASHRDLLDGPVFITLVTLMPDGRPQATPVWCNTDGDYVLVNSARGRQKDRNMRRDPRVSIVAIDPQNPYRWIEVRGQVVAITEEGGIEHINALCKLYTGIEDYYDFSPGAKGKETRVIYRVEPVRVIVQG
ncbi:MAG: PPOX class F420-dependent oxidoreductase [Anaerolineae bacterium]|nr:PPOX class F420-dependent oxidoreductase [Anaerolineae bacterium]